MVDLPCIRFTELVEPEQDLFLGDRWLCGFLLDDLQGKLAFLLFQGFHPFFGGYILCAFQIFSKIITVCFLTCCEPIDIGILDSNVDSI